MKQINCGKGHVYDSKRFPEGCPYCSGVLSCRIKKDTTQEFLIDDEQFVIAKKPSKEIRGFSGHACVYGPPPTITKHACVYGPPPTMTKIKSSLRIPKWLKTRLKKFK